MMIAHAPLVPLLPFVPWHQQDLAAQEDHLNLVDQVDRKSLGVPTGRVVLCTENGNKVVWVPFAQNLQVAHEAHCFQEDLVVPHHLLVPGDHCLLSVHLLPGLPWHHLLQEVLGNQEHHRILGIQVHLQVQKVPRTEFGSSLNSISLY